MYSSRLFFEKKRTNFFFIYLFLPFLVVCVSFDESSRGMSFFRLFQTSFVFRKTCDRNKKCWLADEYQMERGRWLKFSYWIFSLMPLAFFVHRFIAPCRTPPNLIARLLAFPDDTLTMQKSKIRFFWALCVWVSPRDIDRWINPTLPTNFYPNSVCCLRFFTRNFCFKLRASRFILRVA